ncbi:MAG: 2-oxoglutarate dehydrogenase E1 subunit family protein, partial [Alphaproteobacteria bacterium]
MSFLFGGNAVFIAELYSRFVEDPGSVDPSWKAFFDDLQDDPAGTLAEAQGPSWARIKPSVIAGNGHAIGDATAAGNGKVAGGAAAIAAARGGTADPAAIRQATQDSIPA